MEIGIDSFAATMAHPDGQPAISDADRMAFLLEEVERGVWMIRTAQVIPDNERWLHTPEAKASLDEALEWSDKTKRSESDLAALSRKIRKSK